MNIKVRDLKQTETIENENKLMVLVDDDLNLVKNITKEEFLTNIISSTENNSLVQETDGNLYVNTSEIADSVTELDDRIGDIADLTTEDKTSLVAAINEAATKGGGGGNTLFDFKWSDHSLNDISWLRADTFSWQSGGVYTSAYNHLVADIEGITAETETIGGYTVTFYRATDGHKICLADQEQTVLNIYNSVGIAWYYILDTTNTQFKLPRTKYGFEGLRGNVGDYISESLPNHKHDTYDLTNRTSYQGGTQNVAYYAKSVDSTQTGDVSNNSTYQDGAPVQERATQMYLYFYVGDYIQSAIEQTAGLNSELFNNKADIDLTNISTIGKKVIDGQWVSSVSILSQSTSIGTKTFDLSTYLPQDGNIYEVMISGSLQTNSTSTTAANIYTDILNDAPLDFLQAAKSDYTRCFGSLPVRRYIYLNVQGGVPVVLEIRATGYRRLGTNE